MYISRGICVDKATVKNHLDPLVPSLAEAYLQLYDEAIKEKREFFGLRDFYRQAAQTTDCQSTLITVCHCTDLCVCLLLYLRKFLIHDVSCHQKFCHKICTTVAQLSFGKVFCNIKCFPFAEYCDRKSFIGLYYRLVTRLGFSCSLINIESGEPEQGHKIMRHYKYLPCVYISKDSCHIFWQEYLVVENIMQATDILCFQSGEDGVWICGKIQGSTYLAATETCSDAELWRTGQCSAFGSFWTQDAVLGPKCTCQ